MHSNNISSLTNVNDNKNNVYVSKAQAPFTMIPNWLVNDPNVMSETLSAITYLGSKSDTWIPIVKDICNRFKWGDHTWRKVSKQMREYKFLTDQKHGKGTRLVFSMVWFQPPGDNQQVDGGKVIHNPPVDFVTLTKCDPHKTNVHTKERSLTKERSFIKDHNNDFKKNEVRKLPFKDRLAKLSFDEQCVFEKLKSLKGMFEPMALIIMENHTQAEINNVLEMALRENVQNPGAYVVSSLSEKAHIDTITH